MDSATIIAWLSESIYLLVVFGFFFVLSIWKGRQFLINTICGLYFALLFTSQFPYYDFIFKNLSHASVISGIKLGIFIIVTILTTLLFKRLMPSEYQENRFESFPKKILLSLGATILVLSFSFAVLPVAEFLTTTSPIQDLFANQNYFFFWLLAPIIILIIN